MPLCLNPNRSVGFETIFDLCQADFSVLFRRHSGLCQGKGREKMPAEIEKRPKSLNKRADDRFGFYLILNQPLPVLSRRGLASGSPLTPPDHGKEGRRGRIGLRARADRKVRSPPPSKADFTLIQPQLVISTFVQTL